MAGDWIKMRIDLQTHPKVVRILSATKSDKFRVIGGLHAVWSVFDTHCEDGVLFGYTPETLDHIIGWEGFTGALVAVGWLIENTGVSLEMREFSEHNGQSGKRRAEDQKRKRDSRNGLKNVRNLSANEEDKNGTREEKKREEYSVPKGTGDKSPLSTDQIIFGYGLPLLTNAGTPEKQARSFLGGLRKNHGDDAVVNALRDCLKEKPLQPLEWLAAILPPSGATKKPSNRFDAARSVVAAFTGSETIDVGGVYVTAIESR